MAFHKHDYDVYVLLGSPEVEPIWNWNKWQEASKIFEPFTKTERGNAAVRVGVIDIENKKHIKFGKLIWKEKSHLKWVLGSPKNKGISRNWLFEYMEAWTPSWGVCEKENRSPDFYFGICNEERVFKSNIKFNPLIVCAFSVAYGKPYLQQGYEKVIETAKLIESQLILRKRRVWGIDSSFGGFTDSIQDMLSMGLFKPGLRHTEPLSLDLFEENWELITNR